MRIKRRSIVALSQKRLIINRGKILMTRFVQLAAKKGSQKWIQKLINEKPDLLNKQLRMKLDMLEDEEIEWLSPLKEG
jgi:hypothetical protein